MFVQIKSITAYNQFLMKNVWSWNKTTRDRNLFYQFSPQCLNPQREKSFIPYPLLKGSQLFLFYSLFNFFRLFLNKAEFQQLTHCFLFTELYYKSKELTSSEQKNIRILNRIQWLLKQNRKYNDSLFGISALLNR